MESKKILGIIAFSLPLTASFFAQKIMQLIDTMMLGWMGPEALAAGAIGTTIFMTSLVFCMGTLSAVGVLIAHAKSINNNYNIRAILHSAYIVVFALSILCISLFWASPYLLSFLGVDKIIIQKTALFLHGLSIGFPGFLLFLIFRELSSAFSLTYMIMLISLISIPMTFIINYVFTANKYGLFHFGVQGIGYAGSIVMWSMFLFLFIYCNKNKKLKGLISPSLRTINFSKITEILQIGVPSGILQLFESLMFFVAALMMACFGVKALAAYQVAMQCASIAYSIPFSLAMVTAIQVSHIMGTKKFSQLRSSIITNLAIGTIVSFVVAFFFVTAPGAIINIFMNSNQIGLIEINKFSASFLSIAAIFQCLDAVQAVANGALRGLKDTRVAMILSIACYWLFGMTSAYFLAFHTKLGPAGIWYGLTIGLSSAGAILLLRLLRKLNTHKKQQRYHNQSIVLAAPDSNNVSGIINSHHI